MKRILAIVILILLLCPSVFAKDKGLQEGRAIERELLQLLDECRLDKSRWEYAAVTGKDISHIFFYDKKTITSPYPNELEVWWCDFNVGKESCGIPKCVEIKIDTSKHYHLNRWKYDLRDLKMTLLSSVVKNNKLETLDSFDFPLGYQVTTTVKPESIGEVIMNRAKEVLEETKNAS